MCFTTLEYEVIAEQFWNGCTVMLCIQPFFGLLTHLCVLYPDLFYFLVVLAFILVAPVELAHINQPMDLFKAHGLLTFLFLSPSHIFNSFFRSSPLYPRLETSFIRNFLKLQNRRVVHSLSYDAKVEMSSQIT